MSETWGADSRHTAAAHTRLTPGTPCWVSLMVRDPERARKFYEALFGWEFDPGPQQLGPYVRALLGGREVAGIGRLPTDRRVPVAWTPYLATDDIDATAHAIRVRGGTVGVGPLDAAEAGRMLIASDPAGAVFGVWQAAAHRGAAVTGVPGAPSWDELVTRDTGVTAFYTAVFGYTARTAGSPTTLLLGERPVASVRGVGRKLPHDRGAHWMTYFEVDEVDGAAARVAELGGRVAEAPRPGPYGRTATVADPEGARFALVSSGRGTEV
ncbi:VOC family protein [Streptomyces sp. NPDC058045]|uniref:VOC family protein n=1 Tax=Streptomyces sp. NPDC058045 TaxID=3346311 RepID=UPI0036EBC69D